MKLIKPLIKPLLTTLSGIEIGVPLNILSKTAVSSSLSPLSLSPLNVCLNFILGYTTYKADRYLDAEEYCSVNECELISYESKNKMSQSNESNKSNKSQYYSSLIEYKKSVKLALFCSYISLLVLIIYYDLGLLLPFIMSTFLYKSLKENSSISYLKPFYVAGMWSFCTCIIPLLLGNNDINNDILQSTVSLSFIDYYQLLSPTFLTLFSTTNLADLKDIQEDLTNGVNTLPIVLGINKTKGIILISSFLSVLIFIQNQYFTFSPINCFFVSSCIFPNFHLFKNFTVTS